MAVKLSITFKSGGGSISAILQYGGTTQDEKQSIDKSGDIEFPDAGSGDSITISVVCTGTAELTMDVETTRTYPVVYKTGKTDDVFFIS